MATSPRTQRRKQPRGQLNVNGGAKKPRRPDRDGNGKAPKPCGSSGGSHHPSRGATKATLLTSPDELAFGRVIGRGTQGQVRLARHRTTGKRYVVKQLFIGGGGARRTACGGSWGGLPGLSSVSDQDARALEAEAELLRAASCHPNVVRFHGCFRMAGEGASGGGGGDGGGTTAGGTAGGGEDGVQLCIVMSHCEGGDLATLLRNVENEPLPEEAIMRWLVQLLLGLNHIHSMAILHRDIKPANVFLTKSLKVVKIGDFGIAKRLSNHDDFTSTVVGTPYYMSPELCVGKPYTYASDIWALGCTVYELASGGVKAFDARGLPQLVVKIIRNDYAPVPSHFSRPFANLIASMLNPDPAERPTAAQLLNTQLVRRHCDALLAEAALNGRVKPGGVAAAVVDATVSAIAGGTGGGGSEGTSASTSRCGTPRCGPVAGSPRFAPPGVLSSVASFFSAAEANPAAAAAAAAEGSAAVRSIARVQSMMVSSRAATPRGAEVAATRGRAINAEQAQRAAASEKQREAEARYQARQTALRRTRQAVREADPRRIAAQARAEAQAQAKLAEQELRRVTAAEELVLAAHGLSPDIPSVADPHAMGKAEDAVKCTRDRGAIADAAFAARPKLDRTLPGHDARERFYPDLHHLYPDVESDTSHVTLEPGRGPMMCPGDLETDPEAALAEALMAEARADAEVDPLVAGEPAPPTRSSEGLLEHCDDVTGTVEDAVPTAPESTIQNLERELEACFADVEARLEVLERVRVAASSEIRGSLSASPGGLAKAREAGIISAVVGSASGCGGSDEDGGVDDVLDASGAWVGTGDFDGDERGHHGSIFMNQARDGSTCGPVRATAHHYEWDAGMEVGEDIEEEWEKADDEREGSVGDDDDPLMGSVQGISAVFIDGMLVGAGIKAGDRPLSLSLSQKTVDSVLGTRMTSPEILGAGSVGTAAAPDDEGGGSNTDIHTWRFTTINWGDKDGDGAMAGVALNRTTSVDSGAREQADLAESIPRVEVSPEMGWGGGKGRARGRISVGSVDREGRRASRDAALERHVYAKLRSFLRSSTEAGDGGGSTDDGSGSRARRPRASSVDPPSLTLVAGDRVRQEARPVTAAPCLRGVDRPEQENGGVDPAMSQGDRGAGVRVGVGALDDLGSPRGQLPEAYGGSKVLDLDARDSEWDEGHVGSGHEEEGDDEDSDSEEYDSDFEDFDEDEEEDEGGGEKENRAGVECDEPNAYARVSAADSPGSVLVSRMDSLRLRGG